MVKLGIVATSIMIESMTSMRALTLKLVCVATKKRKSDQMPMRKHNSKSRCQNYLCNVPLSGGRLPFCVSCRYMAKRTRQRWLPVAVIVGGIIWSAIQHSGLLKGVLSWMQ